MRIVVSSLLVAFFGAGCGPSAPLLAAADDQAEVTRALGTTKLRLMAGNLSTGNSQDYNSGHGIRIFQGCHPDIALVQELSYGRDTDADIRSFVDTAFGAEFTYVRGAPTTIPNAIVSRYPIIASGEWEDSTSVNDRGYVWAHIDLPGPNDLWALSLHLSTNGSLRAVESAEILANIRSLMPPDDYLVIGGDFNTKSRTDVSVRTFGSVVVTTGPYPVDQRGNENTNASRKEPYDWVVVSPSLQALKVPTVMGSVTFVDGFVADTRYFTPIADLAPALPNDSIGPSMQHMAVVRDFELATASPPPPASVKVLSPNGGERFVAGTVQTIRWSSVSIDTVDVSYAADGVHFTTIAALVPASARALDWSVPFPASGSARIRVSDSTDSIDPTHSDTSDGDFFVDEPAWVKVVSPNGGEVFTVGTSQTISWQTNNVIMVDVAYSFDGVTFVDLGTSLLQPFTTSLVWSVPGPVTASAVIRVRASNDASISDLSDSAFAVQAPPPMPKVKVLSPNGGETLVAGSTQTLRWSSTGVSRVDLTYTTDGFTFQPLANGVDAAAGELSWVVPKVVTTMGLIVVTDANSFVSDMSDGVFTVVPAPVSTPKIIINEILANEPGGATAAEFVELVNIGTAAVDLSGWSVSDSVAVRHRFAAGTVMAAGATLVVFANNASAPAGITSVGASTGQLNLGNGGDTVILADAAAAGVDGFAYGSPLALVDGVSMTRSPDRTAGAPFVRHTAVSTANSSPGF